MEANRATPSFIQGFRFEFHLNDHYIEARASAKSGREIIVVDGEEVSRKLSWRRRSSHQFWLDDHKVEVEFYLANMFSGELHCSLIVDDTHDETKKQVFAKSSQFSTKTLLTHFAVGAVIGVVGMSILLKLWGA